MQELVVISGKGGTGKTSVTASFAVLASRPAIADCDVDAADLHLILSPRTVARHEFRCGHQAVIRPDACIRCGNCLASCRFQAVKATHQTAGGGAFWIDPTACEGCGVCVRFCPAKAIDFPERLCGEWRVSETRCGPMVHARLGVAAENSGKLVSLVRREARRLAEEQQRSLIIVDGPPGIGCPVIASLTGASLVLVVTEPTVAGEHDLERVLRLTRHFQLPVLLCVNKWDVNPELAGRIETRARAAGAQVAGRIRYDRAVPLAQMRQQAVVEGQTQGSAHDIRELWEQVKTALPGQAPG